MSRIVFIYLIFSIFFMQKSVFASDTMIIQSLNAGETEESSEESNKTTVSFTQTELPYSTVVNQNNETNTTVNIEELNNYYVGIPYYTVYPSYILRPSYINGQGGYKYRGFAYNYGKNGNNTKAKNAAASNPRIKQSQDK